MATSPVPVPVAAARLLLNYNFQKGRAENPDTTRPASVHNCVPRRLAPAMPMPDWGLVHDSLEFGKDSWITLPAIPEMDSIEQFTVETLVCPAAACDAAQLLSGGFPASLELQRDGNRFRCKGGVRFRGGILRLEAETRMVVNTYAVVALVATGREVCLAVNGEVVGRRPIDCSEYDLEEAAETRLGGAGEGRPFVGGMGGFRLWEGVPPVFARAIEAAAAAGLGEIEAKYVQYQAQLKKPLGPEKAIYGGRMCEYEGGDIYWSAETGAHVVWDYSAQVYKALRGQNRWAGFGFPVADGRGPDCRFQNGIMLRSNERQVGGYLREHFFAHYMDLGAEKGFLGYPDGGDAPWGKGSHQRFEHGIMLYSEATGVHEVHGLILTHYQELKGPTGFLGLPVSDEERVMSTPPKSVEEAGDKPAAEIATEIGRVSRFENGAIYWSRNTGAHEVHGAIRDLYESMGGPAGKMGFPTSDECAAPESKVRYNEFENGIIVWRPDYDPVAVTTLTLKLGEVVAGSITDVDDIDNDAEVVTHTTMTINGTRIEKDKRRPADKAGCKYNINHQYIVGQPAGKNDANHTYIDAKVNSKTVFHLKIVVDDWDRWNGNDHLATLDRTLDLAHDAWGLLRDKGPLFSGKVQNAYFTYSIAADQFVDYSCLRKRNWWYFDNFKTAQLPEHCFVQTFRNVELPDHWAVALAKGAASLLAPGTFLFAEDNLDNLFYHGVYRWAAAKGNCFGMSLEFLRSLAGQSMFAQPLDQYRARKRDAVQITSDSDLYRPVAEQINIYQGYNVSAPVIGRFIWAYADVDYIKPLRVYERVKALIAKRNYPVLSLVDITEFRGHAVVPYKFEDADPLHADPSRRAAHRLYIADPNLPWRRAPAGVRDFDPEKMPDPTYIEIYTKDYNGRDKDTFQTVNCPSRFASETPPIDVLPGSVMLEFPYAMLSSRPRAPLWELMLALSAALGGILLVAGDAESEQVSAGGATMYGTQGGKRMPLRNGIPGMGRIPLFDSGQAPELYAVRGAVPASLELQLKGLRNGSLSHYFRTRTNAVGLKGPVAAGASDRVLIERANSPVPMYGLTTSEAGKALRLDYAVAGERASDYRRFIFDVPVARQQTARAGLAELGKTLHIEGAGPERPIDVVLETCAGGRVRKLRYEKVPLHKALRLRPRDADLSSGELIVERTASFGGPVVERLPRLRGTEVRPK